MANPLFSDDGKTLTFRFASKLNTNERSMLTSVIQIVLEIQSIRHIEQKFKDGVRRRIARRTKKLKG